MFRFFITLSIVFHIVLFAWLWTHAPQTSTPIVQTAPANVNTIVEPPATLNATPPSEANAKTEPSANTNTAATPLNPAANSNLATATSKPLPNNASNNSATNTPIQNGNSLSKQPNQAAASSTDKPSATDATPASPKVAASTAPLKNTPLTRTMSCPAFAKRQAIVGQITVHVTMSSDGSVKSARVNSSTDASMNDLALAQAKQLKFPVMRNADGVAIESFADVSLKYDCRSN